MNAFIFDTETTGLISNHLVKLEQQPEIIEFYGNLVDLDTGEILNEVEYLIKPKGKIDDIITRITTINAAMVEEAPRFGEVLPTIRQAIESAPLVIAHNASFDREIVDIEFERRDATLKWPKLICTVEATIHLRGYRLSLSALHEYLFGEVFTGAHRARVDVAALTRCACELRKRGCI